MMARVIIAIQTMGIVIQKAIKIVAVLQDTSIVLKQVKRIEMMG